MGGVVFPGFPLSTSKETCHYSKNNTFGNISGTVYLA